MNRLQNNLEILKELEIFYKSNPDIRFFQGLYITGVIEQNNNRIIVDKFNEESNITLRKLNM